MYGINISYATGDSFGSEDCEDDLGITWTDLEFAKKSLERIKEHYKWYKYENHYLYKGRNENPPKRPEWHDNKYDSSIKLLLDEGKEVDISAFWCGYFEILYGASIVSKVDPDMSFSTSEW